MYDIEFYSTADGTSELWDFLVVLQQKALTNKDARIQHSVYPASPRSWHTTR